MKYLGGKFRCRKQIAGFLNELRENGQPYWEPFVGSGWVLSKIVGTPNAASDICLELIDLWNALQRGWIPPETVTEEEYAAAKRGEVTGALRAFIGFGCSFSGKWFGGYAREGKRGERNFADVARRSLLRKLSDMPPTIFFHSDYRIIPPLPECLIYCDPPYAGTTGYDAVGKWDVNEFWDTVRNWVGTGHTVVVSEYIAPEDFDCVLEMNTKTDLRTKKGKEKRIERLFIMS